MYICTYLFKIFIKTQIKFLSFLFIHIFICMLLVYYANMTRLSIFACFVIYGPYGSYLGIFHILLRVCFAVCYMVSITTFIPALGTY